MKNFNSILNLGLFGHVDAGKTTLTEQILFLTENIRTAGNVDKGTSHSDLLEIEKERGISIKASSISIVWKDTLINLIDTPGHIDFSAEVERSLSVIDSAILIISAVEGIQAHTQNIWNALKEKNIPTIIFINKIDRVGASALNVFESLKTEFENSFFMFNTPLNEAENNAEITQILYEANTELIEFLAERDDSILTKYLNEEKFLDEELIESVIKQTRDSELYPVFCGVTKNSIGVSELLNFALMTLSKKYGGKTSDPSALVYKIEHDQKLGKLAGVRVFSGSIKNRDSLFVSTQNKELKVSQIKKFNSSRFEDHQILSEGEIGYLCGLNEIEVGDIIGDQSLVPYNPKLNKPLLTVKVAPKFEKDYTNLAEALQILNSEDPHLNFIWYKEEHELKIDIMGTIQTEVVESILYSRFNIPVQISNPTVIYKETPSKKSVGIERYTMPKPCWAVVKFEIIPGKRGSGIVYSSKVGVNDIQQKYQNEIESVIGRALEQGIKGWNVTDLEIRLIEGEDHVMHSRPGDFKLATLMAIMNGLNNGGTDLLEPVIEFKITADEEFLGKVTNDIINMRGTFESPTMDNSKFILTGKYPLSTSMDYFIKLSSMTGGKAKLFNKFAGYEICPDDLGEIREYKGINPLDRSKFILKWRGAIIE